jgi:NAD(P)-dependent dehydrogenase (short-subunit alcohol dehydrogenase family)
MENPNHRGAVVIGAGSGIGRDAAISLAAADGPGGMIRSLAVTPSILNIFRYI